MVSASIASLQFATAVSIEKLLLCNIFLKSFIPALTASQVLPYCSLSQAFKFSRFPQLSRPRSCGLPTTSSGLAAGGGIAKARTRAERLCPTQSVGRVEPPLAPNRLLGAAVENEFFDLILSMKNDAVLICDTAVSKQNNLLLILSFSV